MKFTPVIAAFALATLLACGGGSNTIYTLSTGTYTLSNTAAVPPDNCRIGPVFRDSRTINLTVAANSVTFVLGGTANPGRNPVPSLQGNTIGTDFKTFDFDNNTLIPPGNFNCVETDTFTIVSGSLLANDQLNATLSFGAVMKSGNACTTQNLGYNTFPCSSTESFILKKM